MARRRTTTKRKPAAKAKPKAAPKPVTAGPGEQLWILDVPYDDRQGAKWAGAQWDGARRRWVYAGTDLPDLCRRWLPAPFSWEEWLAHKAQGTTPADLPGTGTIELRPHQRTAADLVVRAHQAGRPGFLIADDLGIGKTFEAIAAVHAIANATNVLVVAPLSVLAGWRKSLRELGTGGKRWCLVNPDRLKHLVDVPKSAQDAKRTNTKNKRIAKDGKPLERWDVVIYDESHIFRNPVSQRTFLSRSLAGNGAFVIWMSATAGQTPLELSYLAPVLGTVTGKPVRDLEQFEQWCVEVGISVRRGSYGKWEWDPNPADLKLMREMLFGQHNGNVLPLGIRRLPSDIAGWPEQQRVLHPIELDADARRLYDDAWTDFRRQMKLASSGRDPANGLAAQTRFRQKASLLRVPGTVELVAELLGNGRQVFVSVQWIESLDAIAEELAKRKVDVAEIHGQMPEGEREEHRQAFQTGECKVIIGTICEGVNLQANEQGGGNDAPRTLVAHDARWSSIQMRQIEGRGTRSGEHALAYYCYAVDTVEEKVIIRAVERMGNMAEMQGDDADDIRELEGLLTGEAVGYDDPVGDDELDAILAAANAT